MAKSELLALDGVLRIRRAELEAARAAMLTANDAVLRARDKEAVCLAVRDHAEGRWQESLARRLPDPLLVRRAGHWLVRCEKEFEAARLDTAIAEGELETLHRERNLARARLDASTEVRSNIARTISRRREADELISASDAFLRRWRR